MHVRSHYFGILLLATVVFANIEPFEAAEVRTPADSLPALNLREATHRSDGSFEFRVDWAWDSKILVESSSDLVNWTSEGLHPPNSPIAVTNSPLRGQRQFYRARDFLMRISGTIRHIETEMPIDQARVTLRSPAYQNIFTETDAQGQFHLIAPGDPPPRDFRIEKEGYDRLELKGTLGMSQSDRPLALWLAPAGYRPPNDDFENRLLLEGTNVAVHARTFAATWQPDEQMYVTYDDYSVGFPRNLWWTWIAPKDGAVLIEPAPDANSGVVVFTGQSLQVLERVWDITNPKNAFFVTQGIQYQIGFGTSYWPADTGFTLKMVSPAPPSELRAWPGEEGYPGASHSSTTLRLGELLMFGATAQGTAPLIYQWRRDGIEIPGETNASLLVTHNVSFDDAGDYSVVVSNMSGAAVSEPIQISVVQERSHQPEIMRGTWTMGTFHDRQIVTFTDDQFTVMESDGTSVGSGHYQLIGTWQHRRYHLIMTYTAPAPMVHDYDVFISESNGSYNGSIIAPDDSKIAVSGSFRRLEEPIPPE